MGVGHAVAFAILLVGGAASLTGLVATSLDTQEKIQHDWRLAIDNEMHHAATALRIDSVTTGATTQINATNTGRTTLLVSGLHVLVDGTLTPIDSHDVDNRTSNVWPPFTPLRLNVTAPAPASLTLSTATGHQAYWRA